MSIDKSCWNCYRNSCSIDKTQGSPRNCKRFLNAPKPPEQEKGLSYEEKIELIIAEHPWKKTTDHEMCRQIEQLAISQGIKLGLAKAKEIVENFSYINYEEDVGLVVPYVNMTDLMTAIDKSIEEEEK